MGINETHRCVSPCCVASPAWLGECQTPHPARLPAHLAPAPPGWSIAPWQPRSCFQPMLAYQIVGQGMSLPADGNSPRAPTCLLICIIYSALPGTTVPTHSTVLGPGSDVLMAGKQAGAGPSQHADLKASSHKVADLCEQLASCPSGTGPVQQL